MCKWLIAFVGLGASSLCWACPDLSGAYVCPSSGATVLQTSQSVDSSTGVTTYNIFGTVLVTDGFSRVVPEDNQYYESYTVAWCTDENLLVTEVVGVLKFNQWEYHDIEYLSKVGDNLVIDMLEVGKDTKGNVHPTYEERMICTPAVAGAIP